MSPTQGLNYYRGPRERSMTTAEDGEHWTGPRLTARLLALKGVAPDPVLHIVFRSTRRVDGSLMEGYFIGHESHPLGADALDNWLTTRLGSADRLAIAVLVIREVLDTRGMILQCTIERRRGSADGPFSGNPARVDFAGAATAVRLYRSHPDGRLTEMAPSSDTAPPQLRSPDQFAGERKALQARFGAHVHIVDSREPTLFEDLVGLSSVAHVRTADGRDIGCGIGWFGDMAFVLEADFPRFSAPLELPETDAAAVDAALRDNDLIRGETRLDEKGVAVSSRRRGSDALYLLRPDADGVRVEPHVPGRKPAGPDQQRWMHYAETYEGLTVLDVWRDGDSDDVIVLTGDASGQIWRHHIDADGVETWRKADDEAAIGAVHRERLFPGMLAEADIEPASAVDTPPMLSETARAAPEGSLLAQAETYVRAMAALRAARNTTPEAAGVHLSELLSALEMLGAHVTAAALRDAMGRFDTAMLAGIEQALRQELTLVHCVTVAPPRARWLQADAPPFGASVAIGFPSISYDIEEATLCLALRRPTACAFHCMQILERGIGALANYSGVSNPLTAGERNWDAILRMLNAADDAKPAVKSLDGVRKRWRGAALVAGEKYTEEEAERIFMAAGTFMRSLAGICDERGTRTEPSRQS